MNIIIKIYIVVCILLLVFDITFLIIKKIINQKFNPPQNKLKVLIHNELNNYSTADGFSDAFKKVLINKISKTKNLIILINELETIEHDLESISLELRPYILRQISHYKLKSDYEQAYYCYIISKFEYSKEPDQKFYAEFIKFLDSKSLYTFTNAMNVIYQWGDPYIMSLAIAKYDARGGFYHKKLFVDGLLSFEGDQKELASLVINKFYQYSPLTQESLLNYFRLKDIDVSDFCMNLILTRKVKIEVIYAAMRYFIKHPNQDSKIMFIDILQSDAYWIEQMLAIQGLMQHRDSDTKSVIQTKVTDQNWYVRQNAIAYLYKYHLSRNEIYNILSLKDRYANEALLYQYRDDSEISNYIINTIQMLKQSESKDNDYVKEPATV